MRLRIGRGHWRIGDSGTTGSLAFDAWWYRTWLPVLRAPSPYGHGRIWIIARHLRRAFSCESCHFAVPLISMETAEIRRRYLEFFKSAPRNHVIIPSAPLVSSDSTTLFTGSGMQPLLPYLLGQKHPEGKRLADSQKSFRAEDIDEVGDNRHTTFFEMLGNWSFGDYWKEEQLPWFFDFLTNREHGVGLDPARLYVTVFSGGEGIARDDESIEIWEKLFARAAAATGKKIDAEYGEMDTEEKASKKGMADGQRIFGYGIKKNWWSRTGVPSKMPAGEPGGPDSEVFYRFDDSEHTADERQKFGEHCHPNCDCGRFLEIGNSVFMEYKKREDGSFEKLAQRNVDFGGGLERITAAANGDPDVFKIDVFQQVMDFLGESVSLRSKRIITDHSRSSVFLIADGVRPSNKEQGYVLRRLMRRAISHIESYNFLKATKEGEAFKIGNNLKVISEMFIEAYGTLREFDYLLQAKPEIIRVIQEENERFEKVSKNKVAEKLFTDEINSQNPVFLGQTAFVLVSTYGFPIDWVNDVAYAFGKTLDRENFDRLFKEHQDLSRTSSAGMFKGGLADHSEQTIKLHTAHHLLLRALQTVLGPQVKQRGSNITSERLRLDFNYDGKMTDEQKREVEKIVNEKIAEDLPVIRSEMAREDAEKLGAEHEFGAKYPERVSVYSIGPRDATQADPKFAQAFSIEFCGGPHVARTGEIGHFKLVKEEAVAAGVRRVRGVVD
jgi:alanyl-tRNA synthetase